ncbi:MAG: hypothetical protein C0513_03020 [Isosphaera sp.]|nr:hypothetical protein [Isosphaera sp.]
MSQAGASLGGSSPGAQRAPGGGARGRDLVRLARPKQWAKGAFVIVGPVYGMALETLSQALAVAAAFVAFGLASSACYVVNDIVDRDRDRNHPRKRRRPIASGAVTVAVARALAVGLGLAAVAAVGVAVWAGPRLRPDLSWIGGMPAGVLLGAVVGVYAVNTLVYSVLFKNMVIVDVLSLALGFVLRVVGGCAALLVDPSSWLLNVTLFLSMFLAFGKRLGERRALGSEQAGDARSVQARYTDELLRMMVGVTAVACLLTYCAYVVQRAEVYTHGINWLWLTVIPATYGLLRAMLLVETGEYDDPTEIAAGDRPFQLAALLFAALTLGLLWWFGAGEDPAAGGL